MNIVKYSNDLSRDDSLLFIHQSIKSINAILESAIAEEFMKPFVNDLFLKVLLTYENCMSDDAGNIHRDKINKLKLDTNLHNGLFLYTCLCRLRSIENININIK